jgi:hypothetical protein
MRRLRALVSRLAGSFRKEADDRDLAREIDSLIELHTE